jgi:arsenate reductase (thioredoxin)
VNTVIFACVHSAGRSQMASAFFNLIADADKARSVAAGTEPAERIHPEVVQVMREVGVDMSTATPRRLTDELAEDAALIVTMGCGEACPFVPGLERIDWALPDPKGLPPEQIHAIRDEIRRRVAELVTARGWLRQISPQDRRDAQR